MVLTAGCSPVARYDPTFGPVGTPGSGGGAASAARRALGRAALRVGGRRRQL